MNNSFIKKYKPKNIDELIIPSILKNKFNYMIANYCNMSNLILVGPPGTGKTCAINCLLKQIYGIDYKNYILDLNTFNNRNLDNIFSSMTNFCKKKIDHKIKIILIDDSDIIIKKTQFTICNFIEEYNDNCKFIFICNEINKIIEAIQSRCIIIKFTSIDKHLIINFLEKICDNEKISYSKNALKAIEFISNGDIRQAINILDIIFNGTKIVDEINVNKLSYLPHKNLIKNIINNLINYRLDRIIFNLNLLKNSGYSTNDITLILLNLLKVIKINEDIRINFFSILSNTYIIISNGNDSMLQIYGSISRMIKYLIENK